MRQKAFAAMAPPRTPLEELKVLPMHRAVFKGIVVINVYKRFLFLDKKRVY